MQVNTARITLTSFLAYFIMSAIITPIGIVSQPIAERFGVSITQSTAAFSSLTTGIFIGAVIAIFIFDYLRIKKVVLTASLLTLIGLSAMIVGHSFLMLNAGLLAAGIGCGLALSTAAVVITETYNEKLRPSMLLLTDSFYSGAATISTLLGVYLLSQGWHWWSVYLLAIGGLFILLALALPSTYPEKPPQIIGEDRIRDWPASVFVCGFALLLYLLAVVTVYSWVPNYAETALGMDSSSAGNLIGQFFSGMFFGQLAMFVIVLRAPVKPLLFLCLLLASMMTFGLWNQVPWLTIGSAIFLLGLVGGGILKVAISYGTTLLDPPSPKMVSYLLFNTSLGTAIAPALSALVVEYSNPQGALIFATACYILSTLMLLTAYSLQAKHTINEAI